MIITVKIDTANNRIVFDSSRDKNARQFPTQSHYDIASKDLESEEFVQELAARFKQTVRYETAMERKNL